MQLQAQDEFPRFEIPLSGDKFIETTVSLGEKVLVSKVDEAVKAKYIPTRQYIRLDSNLTLEFDTTPVIPFRHKPKGTYMSDSAYYDFFYDYRKGAYSLITSTPNTFTVEQGKLPNKMYEIQFVCTPEAQLYLDRRINKERVVIVTDNETSSHSVKPRKKRTRVSPLFFDHIANASDVIYIWKEERKQHQDVHAIVWSSDGILDQKFTFTIPEKTVHSINAYQSSEERLLLSGTYSNQASKEASGVFTAVVESGSVLQLNTYSFSDMPHYFDYLDKYDRAEMKRKLARLKKHEKSTEIKTHATPQNVQAVNGGFLMPVEFYSEYNVNEYGITRNGATIAGTPQNLRGYNYSHGLVLRLDEVGHLKHDYYFDINLEYISISRKPLVQTLIETDTLHLGYASKNYFYFGAIKPLQFITLEADSSLTSNEANVVRREAQFVYLPDGHILTYGYETQKGLIGFRKKADIYFIEKRKVR